jgi:16S rRNA (adenine1518-N6/adenine1519-N6)-dimethyltransferase
MKKKFGQNFLRNKEIIDEIINTAEIDENSIVYEIGPGDGALTKEIINKNPKKFLSVEIDLSLKDQLSSLFVKKEHSLIFTDALKFDETSHFISDTIVIGNLPYNISLKLLIKWIYQYATKPWFKKMILMFQKEVAERIVSDENSKKYGRITLITSSLFKVSKVLDINKNNFLPIPKVDSILLQFEPLNKPYLDLKNIKKLEFLSNNLFSSRRKKLKNKIELLFDSETIEKNNLKNYFNLRAENLDRNTFFTLARLLK